MFLYSGIILALFVVLFISISDCRNNIELKIQQNVSFSKSAYNFFFFCLILLFWFLTAFRDSTIGNDTSAYLRYYHQIANSGVNPKLSIELGFQYFCLFLSKISPNPYFLLIVSSTICYSICGIYIYKNSHNVLYSALLLFCVAFSFFASGIRQSIAMVVVLIAYSKIKEGKKISPIILIALASSFHISALVVLLWFTHKYIPKKTSVVLISSLVIAVLSASGTLNSLLMLAIKEYQSYFEAEQAGTGWLGVTYYCLRAFVIYLLIYTAYKDSYKENSLIISNAVLLLTTICFGFSVNLFSRASLYFLLATVIDLPNAFNSGKIKNRNMLMLITGTVMLAYFLTTLIIRPEWNNLYPYQFQWN